MIRIYHLEKYAINREAFKSLCENQARFFNAGDGNDSKMCFNNLSSLKLHVILLDMELERDNSQPILDTIAFCELVRSDYPDLKIVLHSPYKRVDWVNKLIAAGATGFVSKNSGFAELQNAIETVDAGSYYFCPLIARQFSNIPAFLIDNTISLRLKDRVFSKREIEVLELISQGHPTREIASRLFVSAKTIETHRKNLAAKTGVKNTAEMINFVVSRGLLLR